jgi:small conductance mechanosensitive channel
MSTAMARILDRGLEWTLTSGLRVVLIVGGVLVSLWLYRTLTRRLQALLEGVAPTAEQAKRAATLTHIVRDVGVIALVVVAGMMILAELGIDLKPILAAAGIGGLAIGFGAQSLVKDVISGFFLLLENQVRVGDVVNIGGTGGLVEGITLRTIVLRDLAGNVHIIPHGGVDRVTNMTKDYSRYVFDVGVAYREDPDEVMQILREIGEELRRDPEFGPDILEPLEILGVDKFADSAVIIKCRITTKPIQQWRIGREMNRRIKKAFDLRGIEIPFPHQTLYWGAAKDGSAPPLRLAPSGDGAAIPARTQDGTSGGAKAPDAVPAKRQAP